MRLPRLALALACALPLAAQECDPTQPEQPSQQAPDPGVPARPEAGDRSTYRDPDWSRPWMSEPELGGHRTPSASDDELDALLFLAHDVASSPAAGAWAASGACFSRDIHSLKDLSDSMREVFDETPILRRLYEFWLRVIRARIRKHQEEKEAEAGDDSSGGGDGGDPGGDDTELNSLLTLELLVDQLLGGGGGGPPPDGPGPDPTLGEYLALARDLTDWGDKVKGYRDRNVTDPEERKMYDGAVEDIQRASQEVIAAAAQDFGEDAVREGTGRGDWRGRR